jgi:hypothetical protein
MTKRKTRKEQRVWKLATSIVDFGKQYSHLEIEAACGEEGKRTSAIENCLMGTSTNLLELLISFLHTLGAVVTSCACPCDQVLPGQEVHDA